MGVGDPYSNMAICAPGRTPGFDIGNSGGHLLRIVKAVRLFFHRLLPYRMLMTASRRALTAIAAFGVFASVAAFTKPAFHIGLASSSPAKDSHVMTPIKEIRLTFTGPINVATASVEMLTGDKLVPLDSLRAVTDSPRVAVARVPGQLLGGTYTVKWKAVAADGANGSGSFNFMYMPPKTGGN